MKEFRKNIGTFWVGYQVGAISRKQLFRKIDETLLKIECPDSWLIALSQLERSNDEYQLRELVNASILEPEDDSFKLGLCIGAFKSELISVEELDEVLQHYFINEEYGHFDSPREDLNKLYDQWQGPPSSLTTEELYCKLAELAKSS